MIVYITKYLFTKGIVETEASKTSIEGMLEIKGPYSNICLYKGEYHESLEEAFVRRDKMIENRLKSLKNSIAKVEKTRELPVRKGFE